MSYGIYAAHRGPYRTVEEVMKTLDRGRGRERAMSAGAQYLADVLVARLALTAAADEHIHISVDGLEMEVIDILTDLKRLIEG